MEKSRGAGTRIALWLLMGSLMVAGLILAGCGNSAVKPNSKANPKSSSTSVTSQPQSAVKPETPVAPENNPPGDIPDSQVFIVYKPPNENFEVKVPEGWQQANTVSNTSFTDKLNTVTISSSQGATQPTVESANSIEVPQLEQSEAAFKVVDTRQVSLPGGQAVLIKYQKNSAPNQVTGKQYRMDVERFEFFNNGRQVNLVLESPVGADNVDPWKTISESFKWD
jgi:hypothetical protein